MSYLFMKAEDIIHIKEKLNGNSELQQALANKADTLMQTPPLSVTFHKSPAASGNSHDYFSEGPYWWPDEKNLGGPYIRRDGEVNPNRFNHHFEDMQTLSDVIAGLAQAGLFLESDEYMQKAVSLAEIWFVNKATKMSPHLEYGQAVRGICDGRSIGIIDTAQLIKVVAGLNLIEQTGKFTEQIELVKDWFRDYVYWMNHSKKGLEEKNYFNNHANWWNTQAAVFSAFAGDDALMNECFEKYRTDVIPNQTNNEGAFSDELTRTISYFYTLFNLEACAITCELAYHKGVDLWNFITKEGKGIKKSISFFKPYYINPFLWPHQQLNAHKGVMREWLPMRLAALHFCDAELRRANQFRREDMKPFTTTCNLGLLDLIQE
ncbi:MAG: alginate lyase family protein [Eubacteriales bacterium]